jgi:hypothetical protein
LHKQARTPAWNENCEELRSDELLASAVADRNERKRELNMPDSKSARHALEEAFFRDVDAMIMQRLRSEADSPDASSTLMQSTGLRDPILIDELCQLGVSAEGLIAMRLVPLVLVAWADNVVNEAERETVLAQAHKVGVVDGSVASVLLEHWLNQRPPSKIIDAWKRYMSSELAAMSKAAKKRLIALMEAQMTAVAEASGGHLGMGKTSQTEQQLIEMMTRVLRE